jgi:hypothetical protein
VGEETGVAVAAGLSFPWAARVTGAGIMRPLTRNPASSTSLGPSFKLLTIIPFVMVAFRLLSLGATVLIAPNLS